MTATDTAMTLARVAAQAAADKLAKDILLVDVSDRLAITDVFVIVTGANERQVGAIVDGGMDIRRGRMAEQRADRYRKHAVHGLTRLPPLPMLGSARAIVPQATRAARLVHALLKR